MKKIRAVFVALLLICSVSDSYSQFYDIKAVKKVRTVGTRHEPPVQSVPAQGEANEKPLQRAEKRNSEEENKETEKNSPMSRLSPPLDTLIVTSPYGYRQDPFTGKRKFHGGTDYRTNSQNVYAMMPGRVKKIGYNRRLGNYVTLEHGEFTVTYAHLHTVVGEKGDSVDAGQSVGISGSTGRSTGEHLHVGIRYRKQEVDPHPLIMYIKEWAEKGMATTATTRNTIPAAAPEEQ